MAWAGGLLKDVLVFSYAPVALGFQAYEWVIFASAYKILWRVRQKRLFPVSVDSICAATVGKLNFSVKAVGPEGWENEFGGCFFLTESEKVTLW